MKNSKIMLIDSDSYTSTVLFEELSVHGFNNAHRVSSGFEVPIALEKFAPDIVIFNYHFHQPDSLTLCSTIKLLSPESATMVIVSPGPALKAVRQWAKETKNIDVVIEKPLSDERFYMMLEDLVKLKESTKALTNRTELLANLVPQEAMLAAENHFNNEGEMFEAAILFTDIRRSSKLITTMAPRQYFEHLNTVLSAQSKEITRYEGSVIKYTGDGVMAVFKGMGRAYLALRCGLDLAQAAKDAALPYGVGVAEGLVLAGLIGDSAASGQRRQFDVIGATVHLASRLCGIANAGELIATKSINQRAKLNVPLPQPIQSVAIRGFDAKVDCVGFNLQPLIQELQA